ncbi:MAG TPA: FliM/FliN family flagellar motor switch protein [Vitreimonas sp.]|uniref:FliM/FliN family flagellar motor switch protein n=1 Tax=Vitreimonas sp. TaxID=3069702 RepID=UPI002D55BA4C|nr:FliM/FliN family flagellar motor switch protein [Vitreimonas sp.]HYD85995.1 FliM/FliN family flagellar motor switch protein [Vitreimonas sp.]
MNSHAQIWAPAQALFDDTLAAIASSGARAWAQRWFGGERPVDVRRCEAGRAAGPPIGAAVWETKEPGVVLALDPRAHATLAGWMLGLETGGRTHRPADQQLFENLALAAAHDFAAEAARVFAVAPDLRKREGYRPDADDLGFVLSIGAATNLLQLYLTRACALRTRLHAIGPRVAPRSPRPRAEALLNQPIRLGVMIGRGRMALSELCSLGVGDVVLLDKGQDDVLALTLNGEVKDDPGCELRQDGSRLALRLAPQQMSI